MEENADTYREWTSKRPWKERRRAAKAKENAVDSDYPELIYYGRHSGVIGLRRGELYQSICDSEVSSSGYDKVNLHFSSNFCDIAQFVYLRD